MAEKKRWVLDTDTKGTGAQMVPLEKLEEREGSGGRSVIVVGKPRRRAPVPREPEGPKRFRIVDVMTKQLVAGDVTLQQAVAAMEGMRSVVDVSIYLWDEGHWRALTLGERKALWALRGRSG